MDYGGKVAYVEGDKFHRTHSGSKAGVKADNAGPLIDLILLSESLVSRANDRLFVDLIAYNRVPRPLSRSSF